MRCPTLWLITSACLHALLSHAGSIPAHPKHNEVHALQRREFNIDPATCSQEKRDTLTIELGNARLMAREAKSIKLDSIYYEKLISDFHQKMGEGFLSEIKAGFARIEEMLEQFTGNYPIWITCENDSRLCQEENYFAHMNDNNRNMNFCDRFFDPKQKIRSTNDVIDDCKTIDLRDAHWTRAAVIIHECSHTEFAMLDTDLAKDYAYGLNSCYLLARGAFDRSCAPYKKKQPQKPSDVLCPKEYNSLEESTCVPEVEMKNADTWAFLAAGTYFSAVCGKQIPLPKLPDVPKRPESKRTPRNATARNRGRDLFPRADECPDFDDIIVIDG